MKSRNSLFAAILLLFPLMFSCQKGSEETVVPEGQGNVTFSVSNYRQVSFDDLSSGQTRAGETVSMTLANLSLTVFDAKTNALVSPTVLHKSDDYTDNPSAFAQFSVSLPRGSYRIVILGYNGKKACNIASPSHITWEDSYVPNTFLYCDELTVGGDDSVDKEVTLSHVVAAFRVTAEDAIPATMKRMRFISSTGGTALNALTGFTPQSTGRTSDIDVPTSYAGKTGVDFTVYLFLPSEQTTGSYTVQALADGDAVLAKKTFGNVPLRINYLTQWQGKAFESGDDDEPSVQGGFGVKWNMEWAGTIPIN